MHRSLVGTVPRLTLIAVIVASTSTLSACAGPQAEADPDVVASINGLVNLPPELSIAHNIATADCLRADGYAVPTDATSSGGSGPSLAGVVGLFSSEASARAIGYSTTLNDSETGSIDGFASTLSGIEAKKFDQALWGDGNQTVTLKLTSGAEAQKSNTGCFADADRALYGSVKSAMSVEMFVNEVSHQASTFRADIESQLQDTVPRYEKCMRSGGYDVSGLHASALAASRFGQYRDSGQAPNAEEQAMAAADYRCQRAAGISRQLLNLFAVKAASWLKTQQQSILSLRERVADATGRARSIISDGA